MSKLKPWLLMIGIFVIGAVTGAALTVGISSHFARPPGDHDMKKHWMARLTRELSLTPDQSTKIEPIVADADTKFHALLHDERQQGAQIFKAADVQISALLTPAQQVQLQKMEQEREKMFGGHTHPFSHGGPDGAPPPPGGVAAPPPDH